MTKRDIAAAKALNALRQAEGRHVSINELRVLCGYAHKSGVDYAIKRLQALGYPVRSDHHRGYRFVPTVWEIGK